jgi:hypothetical protein
MMLSFLILLFDIINREENQVPVLPNNLIIAQCKKGAKNLQNWTFGLSSDAKKKHSNSIICNNTAPTTHL